MSPTPPPPTMSAPAQRVARPPAPATFRVWQVLMGILAIVATLGVIGGIGVIWIDAADTTDDWHGFGVIVGAMLAGASAVVTAFLTTLLWWSKRSALPPLISCLWPAAVIMLTAGSAPLMSLVLGGAWLILSVTAYVHRLDTEASPGDVAPPTTVIHRF